MRSAFVLCLLLPAVARAGVEDWVVNEVMPSDDGNEIFRFIELYAPPSDGADNCLFPTSRVDIYDGAGELVGAATATMTTRCYDGDTYFLFATLDATTHWGVDRDANLTVTIPAESGQACFASSATRYDCTRWGTVTNPIPDLYDPEDMTSASSIPDGFGLARRMNTGVVADDFVLQSPTPRQPNDGTIWFPPDAGPPDAFVPIPDAPIYDARVFADAPRNPAPDARLHDPNWFLADPGGGALCTCGVGTARGERGLGLAPLGLLFLVIRLRKRRPLG